MKKNTANVMVRFKVTEEFSKEIDKAIDEMGYTSKSELIRDAIRRLIGD